MKINRYSVAVRHKVDPDWLSQANLDVYIYAHNCSRRVAFMRESVSAKKFIPVFVPEYGYSKCEIDGLGVQNALDFSGCDDESMIARAIIECCRATLESGGSLAIDITGFMRPHIFALAFHLQDFPGATIDFYYAEPGMYEKKEETVFSSGGVKEVRHIAGYHGVHEEDDEEVLIIGAGYDNALVSRVLNDREKAKVFRVLPFPSLSADMYQQGLLQLEKCTFSASSASDNFNFYASAKDPFSVAAELSKIYWGSVQNGKASAKKNVYLCSLATKPQALGFALFYIWELSGEPASVLFPFSEKYSRETSSNVGDLWRYKITI